LLKDVTDPRKGFALPDPESYNAKQNLLMKNKRDAARDIFPLPEPELIAERERGFTDPEFFIYFFFPEICYLKLSRHHQAMISDVASAFLTGGLYLQVLPRGSGKTSLTIGLSLWAQLYAVLRYLVVIAANEDKAAKISDALLMQLKFNQLLYRAFPEACYPFRKVKHVNQCQGQLYNGELTGISTSSEQIIMPNIPGSRCSGAIIEPYGLTGAIRGAFIPLENSSILRPDGFLLDDPQTDESANSESQCATRENLIQSAVLGLAGPGKGIAGVANGSVIRKGDLMDRYLNGAHPEFITRKVKFLESWPDNKELWNQYLDIRADDRHPWRKSNKFYKDHQAAMDKGAVAYWAERLEFGAVTAIQSAYNLIHRFGFNSFLAEYQNEPCENLGTLRLLTRDDIYNKTNGLEARRVPAETQYLTAGIDVQKEILFYVVAAWKDGGTGWIVERDAWPRQPKAMFDPAKPVITLSAKYPGLTPGARIQQAVIELTELLKNTPYIPVNGGKPLPLMKEFCDSGYEGRAIHAAKQQIGELMDPSRGIGLTAAKRPLEQYIRKPGEIFGTHWYYPVVKKTRDFRHCAVDVNWWKAHLTESFLRPAGDPGSLTIYGNRKTDHNMFCDHLTAETYVETEGHGRRVQEWSMKPGRYHNHFLDCLVYSAAAASRSGMALDDDRKKSARGKRVIAKKAKPAAPQAAGAVPSAAPKSRLQQLKEQRMRDNNY
jgi:hypothetical protein